MHPEAREWVQRQLPPYASPPLPLGGALVVELGSRNVNGSVRDLFPWSRYVGVDVRPGRDVDIVGDAASHDLPARVGEQAALVLCLEVLEHAPAACRIVANAARLLRPGGLFVITTAGPQRAPHGVDGREVGTEFYRNVSVAALICWLDAAGFDERCVIEGRDGEDVYAVATAAMPRACPLPGG